MQKCGTQMHRHLDALGYVECFLLICCSRLDSACTLGNNTNNSGAKKKKLNHCIGKGATKTNRETCLHKCGTQIHTKGQGGKKK